MSELTAIELAERLSVTRRHALDLLRGGAITGRQLSSGAWLADADSVARFEAANRRGSGRQLDPDTAWGLLWMLSGLDATWLNESTRSRARARIRRSTAEELARAVSSRTTARRYRAANPEKAAHGLILTGAAAASRLHLGLMDDTRHVCGYVREGSAAEHAARSFMVESAAGQDVIYENTLPVPYPAEVMPPAVIAADLAISVKTRERAAGLRALEEMRKPWLGEHAN